MSKPSSFIRPRGAPLAAAGVPLPPRAWALRTSDPGHRFRSRPLPVAATASGRMVDAGADEALCKAMAFMRREGARRSTR